MKFIKNFLRKRKIKSDYIATGYPEEDKDISIDLVNHFDRPKASHLVDNGKNLFNEIWGKWPGNETDEEIKELKGEK